MSVKWWVTDQISFRSNDLWPSYVPWTLKFGQIFSCLTTLFHHDLIYWLDFLVCVYNHKLQINFEIRSGCMIFCQLTVVGFWNLATYLGVTTFFHYDLRYWLDFWFVSILMSYRSSFNFVQIEWFWANLRTLDY